MPIENEKIVQGKRIKELRQRLHLSVELFARRCGVSTTYLTNIENDRYDVTEELCKKINTEYGVTQEWLLGETEEIKNNEEDAAVNRLKAVLEETGLSQREFCKRIGASNAGLGAIFEGRRKLTVNFAQRIESVFHIGADWLLYGIEEAKDYPCDEKMLRFIKEHPEIRKRILEEMEKMELCNDSAE